MVSKQTIKPYTSNSNHTAIRAPPDGLHTPTGVTVRVVGRASLPGQWHVEDHAGVGKLRQSTELAPIAEVTPRGDEAAAFGEAAL